MDALLSIAQMPPGIPVATVGINGAANAAILAAQILATADKKIAGKVENYKENLKVKITRANEELSKLEFKFKVN
jgi:5-(carboxyamino)imidazole ribonucleotide mutase